MSSLIFRFYLAIVISFLTVGVFSQSLNQNLTEIKSRIANMTYYPTLAKKRLYGAVERGRSIRFELKDAEPGAESIVIGIAGDGSLRDWELTVYNGLEEDEIASILRKEKISNDNTWIFEMLNPPEDIVINIKNLNSGKDLSVVEVIHGYYYGLNAKKFLNPNLPKAGNPANPTSKPKQTDAEKLSPNDTQNRFEIFRAPISQ